MSRLKTWSIHAGVWVVIALVAAGGTALWLLTAPMRSPAPVLTAGLAGSWSEQSVTFDKRVRARYAIGTADQNLGADLDKQGFVRKDWSSSASQEHLASLTRKGLFCRDVYNVYWRADEAGRLSSVRGEHPASTCP
ncbi:MAG: hypothetical protein ABSD80_04810 [Caulobacteraceae bacterium]|jgi:hypothetical protein